MKKSKNNGNIGIKIILSFILMSILSGLSCGYILMKEFKSDHFIIVAPDRDAQNIRDYKELGND